MCITGDILYSNINIIKYFFLELSIQPSLNSILLPRHTQQPQQSTAETSSNPGDTAGANTDAATAADAPPSLQAAAASGMA